MDLLLSQKGEEYTSQLRQDPQHAVWAMITESEDIAIALLSKTFQACKAGWIQNIDFNARYEGTTLLHESVRLHRLKVVQTLLELGANPFLLDVKGLMIVDCYVDLFKEEGFFEEKIDYLKALYNVLFESRHPKIKIDDFKDRKGNTPLMRFMSMMTTLSINEFEQMIDLFIQYGARFDLTNKQGNTLLHILAATILTDGNQENIRIDFKEDKKLGKIAQFIINKQVVKATAKNHHGLAAWEIASILGYIELVDILFAWADRSKQFSFLYQFMSQFVLKRDDISLKFKHSCIQYPADTLHLLLADKVDLKVVKVYLKTWHSNINKNINAKWSQHPEGYTPLHVTVSRGYFTAITPLLNFGADINAVDNAGKTILHHIAQHNFKCPKPSDHEYVRLIEYIFSKKINLNEQDSQGNTALHYLVTQGLYELHHKDSLFLDVKEVTVTRAIALFLARRDINTHILNKDGKTPLGALLEVDTTSNHLSLGRIKKAISIQLENHVDYQPVYESKTFWGRWPR